MQLKLSKKLGRIVVLLLAAVMFAGITAFAACAPETPAVKSIEITTLPTKTAYLVGETFDPAGGVITVTYEDGTTETKSLTDEGVTVSELDTSAAGTMTLTVRYGGKAARFDVTVTHEQFNITFDYGYDGMDDAVEAVNKGEALDEEIAEDYNAAERDGYTFDGWYADETLTMIYDFTDEVTQDITLYAKWLDNTATYHEVTYDYNRGDGMSVKLKIKDGETAVPLASDPVRTGYAFEGWYTSASGDTEYDFSSAITSATTVYAKWRRTATGPETYVFEAEDSNLQGKSGPSWSGTVSNTGMIYTSSDFGASNDRFVGYMYTMGISLEFQIISDMAVDDATLVLRLSAEFQDITIDPSSFSISVNYEAVDYEPISFTNVPEGMDGVLRCLPFEDYTVATGVSLVEGFNIVTLTVMNQTPMPGTTFESQGPLVDCIKITTEAVLSWDASLGLPKDNY